MAGKEIDPNVYLWRPRFIALRLCCFITIGIIVFCILYVKNIDGKLLESLKTHQPSFYFLVPFGPGLCWRYWLIVPKKNIVTWKEAVSRYEGPIQDVLHFWFEETAPAQWFQVNDVLMTWWGSVFRFVPNGVFRWCDGWLRDVDGCLALVLLFDQFPRNMFRDTAQAFEFDGRALDVARKVVDLGFDHLVSVPKRRFFLSTLRT